MGLRYECCCFLLGYPLWHWPWRNHRLTLWGLHWECEHWWLFIYFWCWWSNSDSFPWQPVSLSWVAFLWAPLEHMMTGHVKSSHFRLPKLSWQSTCSLCRAIQSESWSCLKFGHLFLHYPWNLKGTSTCLWLDYTVSLRQKGSLKFWQFWGKTWSEHLIGIFWSHLSLF